MERSKVLSRIPSFWRLTLTAHPLIHEMATEDDERVLEHCTEVRSMLAALISAGD